ncbi:unnamed protein product [Paramecium pentaurelia]|uniref:Uncharacterized protein n=1 Tax=Paramecium pentaurelia TaxID=43138 RepID=A0A8S1THU2_9CILI|nr:unnamed protein product [Paramecium pentaurelia]
MKIILYIVCFTIVFAQEYKTIYTAFEGSNYNDDGWFIYYSYGGKYQVCHGEKLLGGFSTFGANSLISKQFKLPPHYSVRVQVRFWKIDSWDAETFLLMVDQGQYQDKYFTDTGGDYCGWTSIVANDFPVNIEIQVSHYSSLLTIIMTSNLDEVAYNESWGINTFILGILQCPQECLSCEDSTSNCIIWSNLASYWQNSMIDDGWLINGNEPLSSSICGGIEIAGGYPVLQQGHQIENRLQDLPIHFQIKIVFKVWVIGDWLNEIFALQIDNNSVYSLQIENTNLPFICGGIKQKVKIINVQSITSHTSEEINMVLSATQTPGKIASWGISSLDLYIAKCSNGCQVCYGIKETECNICIKKWGFYQNKCIPAPSIECSHIQIIQVNDLNLSFKNSFQIKIDEVNKNITDDGNINVIVGEQIPTITFKISVKCQENNTIDSFFRNCNQCQYDQYQFSNKCSHGSNVLLYNSTFKQVIESEKELIIRVSQKRLEIVQLSLENQTVREILIIKIDILTG